MPPKEGNWIGFQATDEEKRILEEYCKLKMRNKTDVLRELVRGLERKMPKNTELSGKSMIKSQLSLILRLFDTLIVFSLTVKPLVFCSILTFFLGLAMIESFALRAYPKS